MIRALPLLALLLAAAPAAAREWVVSPDGPLRTPQEALARAADGDLVRVLAGTYAAPLAVTRSVTLQGEGWPVLDGGGRGTVVRIEAPGVTLRGFVVRGSGISLDEEHSGVSVEGPRAVIEGNRLQDVLFGVYLRHAAASVVRGNQIRGKTLALGRRGDAIRVWNSDGTTIAGNRVHGSRDVVLWYSKRLTVRDNHVEQGRYGLHFMYCDDATIQGNLLADNSVGAFLMYSRRLRLVGNTIAGNHGPSGYGVGLKDMDEPRVADNLFVGNRVAAFLDSTPREWHGSATLEGNLFAGNDIGIRLMPSVRRVDILGNSFVENHEQVELAGGGGDPGANLWRGNYWSDYAGYDADGDGLGDVPYRSQRLFESLLARRPELRLFAYSPAAQAVDFAAQAFPLVRPQPKLEDAAPRMRPHVPAGAPTLPPARGGAAPGLAAAAVLVTAALLALPAHRTRRRRQGSPACAPGHPPPELLRIRSLPRGSAMTEHPLIEVRSLSKSFGRRTALADVSFTVHRGQAVALWGANGAGKTTALRALLGVMPCDGEVAVGGFDVRRQGKQARRLLGFVPQEIAFPEMTAGEALELFARLHRAPLDRIAELVASLGLEGELEAAVHGLSGGRKQRLALAVALLADPPVLLLDEATANLDVAARRDFLELLLELKAAGKTIVFSSHRPEEVLALADRVVHLEGGRLQPERPPRELLADELQPDLAPPPGRTAAAARAAAPPTPLPAAPGGRLALHHLAKETRHGS
ncbi:MAG TPA: nitrous oxide reductase family maturation protein NosD [Thermoanaerobaculia bacterium]|nr:nitrous oxide reductase family maturation protein NosD [Thermoanaerobaculia bacterium]